MCSPVFTACYVNGVVLRQAGVHQLCALLPHSHVKAEGVRGMDLLRHSHGSY